MHFLAMALAGVFVMLFFPRCERPEEIPRPETFSFVFMTDIHVQPERNAAEGFRMAVEEVNRLAPDFVITGGDLIMDALGQTYGRADSLYELYDAIASGIEAKVYNTMGNHEIYGIYESAGADPSHPEYGEKMYENRLGPRYYSFEHKGWKFLILDSVEDTEKGSYIGMIDAEQQAWIREELAATDTAMPLVISTHIPFITIFKQVWYGSTLPNDSSLVVCNAKEVLDLFDGYNLKLVLQGHLHTIEDIYVDGTHFITAGAVCGRWWTGPNRGYEEGFARVHVRGDAFDWEYVDYGWDP